MGAKKQLCNFVMWQKYLKSSWMRGKSEINAQHFRIKKILEFVDTDLTSSRHLPPNNWMNGEEFLVKRRTVTVRVKLRRQWMTDCISQKCPLIINKWAGTLYMTANYTAVGEWKDTKSVVGRLVWFETGTIKNSIMIFWVNGDNYKNFQNCLDVVG